MDKRKKSIILFLECILPYYFWAKDEGSFIYVLQLAYFFENNKYIKKETKTISHSKALTHSIERLDVLAKWYVWFRDGW